MLDAMAVQACETYKMSRSDWRFTRKDVRRFTHWSDFQVHTHLSRLVSLEYVAIRRGVRSSGFDYELLYDGKAQQGRPHLLGLIDVEELQKKPRNGKTFEIHTYDNASLGVAASS